MPQPTNKPQQTRNRIDGGRRVSINTILTVLVAVVAVVVIGGVLLVDRAPQATGETGGARVAAEVLRNPDSHTLLEATDGKVTVVEFLDYQCPACAGYYHNITKQLEQDYAGRITFVTRNFPLEMHPLAVPAARAAEAAAVQGKYAEMYHALYDNYTSWARSTDGAEANADLARGQARFDDFARRIGLDLEQFHRDMNSPETTQRIERDRADGAAAGVSGTPTIFINGTEFTATGNTFAEVDQQLRAQIDEALAS